jgi:predicted component of type VI protein secretion system
MKPENPTRRDPNQGEGDRISSRHYNRQVRDFVAGGKVDPAARDAESFVAQHPDEAARAERKAKQGPKSARLSLDQLIAKGETVIDRVRPMVERTVEKLRARLGRKK